MTFSQSVVLVADDEPDIRAVLAAMFEDVLGVCAAVAADGAEALRVLERERPCAVLLDMRMPVVDGWEFSRRYRRGTDRTAPIVVMTAAENARRRCDEVGGDDCLAKPFDIDALCALVGRFCGRAA